jgi:hypothetical protein
MKEPRSVRDIARNPGQPLAGIEPLEQVPLPPPFDKLEEEPEFARLSEEAREKYVVLDDTIAVNIPKPKSKEEADVRRGQLDLFAAVRDVDGALRALSDVLRCVPDLRGERAQRALSSNLPL